MDADQILETLRNYRDLLPHIERVALSQGIDWSAEYDTIDLMLSPIDQDACILLKWEDAGYREGRGDCPLPIRLLWELGDEDALRAEAVRREKELEAQRHQEAIEAAKRRVSEAQANVARVREQAQAELGQAEKALLRLQG